MAGAEAFELPYPYRRTTPGPTDFYYTPLGGALGYASHAQACAKVPPAMRSDGLTVLLTGKGEYWWLAPDFSDAGLVPKQSGGSGPQLEGSTITRWEAKVYDGDLMVVLYEDNLYYVTDSTPRPFASSDFLDEYDLGLWTLIGGAGTVQTVDSSLWLLTEDGRKITDEKGQIITVN